MSLESLNKSGLIKLCKEKEEELKEKTKALEDKNIEFLNYIKQKDESCKGRMKSCKGRMKT